MDHRAQNMSGTKDSRIDQAIDEVLRGMNATMKEFATKISKLAAPKAEDLGRMEDNLNQTNNRVEAAYKEFKYFAAKMQMLYQDLATEVVELQDERDEYKAVIQNIIKTEIKAQLDGFEARFEELSTSLIDDVESTLTECKSIVAKEVDGLGSTRETNRKKRKSNFQGEQELVAHGHDHYQPASNYYKEPSLIKRKKITMDFRAPTKTSSQQSFAIRVPADDDDDDDAADNFTTENEIGMDRLFGIPISSLISAAGPQTSVTSSNSPFQPFDEVREIDIGPAKPYKTAKHEKLLRSGLPEWFQTFIQKRDALKLNNFRQHNVRINEEDLCECFSTANRPRKYLSPFLTRYLPVNKDVHSRRSFINENWTDQRYECPACDFSRGQDPHAQVFCGVFLTEELLRVFPPKPRLS